MGFSEVALLLLRSVLRHNSAFVAALSGVALSPLAAVAESKPAHSHDHAHDHAKDPAAAKIYAGHFDDDQIKARTLADWAGEWQSVHPLLADGPDRPVRIVQAGALGRFLGRLDLDLGADGRVLGHGGDAAEVTDAVAEDAAAQAIVARAERVR